LNQPRHDDAFFRDLDPASIAGLRRKPAAARWSTRKYMNIRFERFMCFWLTTLPRAPVGAVEACLRAFVFGIRSVSVHNRTGM
jgi:hypothetical protein